MTATTGKLVVIRVFDDTPYPVAPDPIEVSETLYRSGTEHGLLPSIVE